MPIIIGRKIEKEILEEAFQSSEAELVALYGRRRVGKTYLIRNFFEHKEDTLFFTMTGTKDAPQDEQTTNFAQTVRDAFLYEGAPVDVKKAWRDAFSMLTDLLRLSKKKKLVLFFDEFPWMVTKGSRLLRTFEFFWNHYWSRDPRIKLIICGSSSGWILKNIVHNKGGLYNRVTRTIQLEPFNLKQTKEYLEYNNVRLNYRDITDLYMVMGGIPFYLSKVKPGRSAAQVIEEIAFQKNSFMLTEFANLYATLFGSEGPYIAIAREIADHRYGIGQEELIRKVKRFSSGGRAIKVLTDLEQAGFIARLTPFGRKRKGIYYKMIDEYSLFYFRWIEPIRRAILETGERSGYWGRMQNSQSWYNWAGYAFEALCMKHIQQIRKALHLNSFALAYTWRYTPKKGSGERGAQIDLLFDRDDNAITLCEIKYTKQPYAIDKQCMAKLHRQIDVFKAQTKTRKNIFISFIAAEGLKKTIYSEELVHNLVTLKDLYK